MWFCVKLCAKFTVQSVNGCVPVAEHDLFWCEVSHLKTGLI
jgi:hypothetical protein